MRYEFKSVAEIPKGFWVWQHIDPAKEWACKSDGSLVVETDFMEAFEKLRGMMGVALPINSGYRTPSYNSTMPDHTDDGPHTTGMACDVSIDGEDAFHLVAIAISLGFHGIGINQKGASRFVHLDMVPSKADAPRPAIWSY